MEHKEKVILTNMCMVYDENRVLVEEKVERITRASFFRADMLKQKKLFLILL